ncbi:hypothetical protein ACFFKU_00365 [Kineococcus gynurae]|uniref:Knr4/Smi1-like domain-containing protein n=1 Tax=Kineococcus gynurae TaxID=452979 RepID=A0ABV5LXK5_9ACTN
MTTSEAGPGADARPGEPRTVLDLSVDLTVTPPARPSDPPGSTPVAEAEDLVHAAVERRLHALRQQWTRVGADIAARLRPGVAAAELDAAEDRLGLPIPAAARAWWSLVDGVEPVRRRYGRTTPSVGPGGWVPLSLADAVDRVAGGGALGAPTPPGLLPVFARTEELLAVRLGHGVAVLEQLELGDEGDSYQHGWRADLDELLRTWADALLAAVIWLPDAHDWVTDPFAVRALAKPYLID